MSNETYYRVGVGGSPKDSWDTFFDLEAAQDCAMQIALEMAEIREIDPGEIELYDNGPSDMGACPEGDDGAYWPVIEVY